MYLQKLIFLIRYDSTAKELSTTSISPSSDAQSSESSSDLVSHSSQNSDPSEQSSAATRLSNQNTDTPPSVDTSSKRPPSGQGQDAETGAAFSTDEVTMPSVYSIPSDYTNQTDEAHEYYSSSIVTDPVRADTLWIDLDRLSDTVTHDMLSESYRRAATVNLTFLFPFYGHPINNVTIATGGFLYVGYALHLWLAATQYIAPLMANFKASVNSSASALKYHDNGTMFVVEWRNVHLDDKPEAGNFTFQAILHDNGDIFFVYREIPIAISEIAEKNHPVKVGISDAYLFNSVVSPLKRKTIYEYHSINKKSDLLRSHTAIVMSALPTCVSLKTCEECTTAQINFNCTWCDAVRRCSSGVDRHRQSWINNKCKENAMIHKDQCRMEAVNALAVGGAAAAASSDGSNSSSDAGGLLALLVLVVLILALVGWLIYAYHNPRSASGQLLIKYRPSQWKRHGEARYIAAGSLHM
ncbi:plexin domain-containing protein 2-like isoform X2 [Varroa destructor]|uniref:Plexin domain-containing protein 2 n=1 Tax=Varroa destructor TaxID=109461 RepID=A0A7M7MDR2_VARDE|nr:plexin domain-containing protein 2-like isoform X2 [Varroa destructor]